MIYLLVSVLLVYWLNYFAMFWFSKHGDSSGFWLAIGGLLLTLVVCVTLDGLWEKT